MHKIINFSHVLPDYKKFYMATPQFFFVPLEKLCLILQNTLNLEK